ncbi:hypothetical protein [Dactylosporangium sp. NPDC048998]
MAQSRSDGGYGNGQNNDGYGPDTNGNSNARAARAASSLGGALAYSC